MPGPGACDRELIERALAGDAQSLETLAGVVRVRVYSYLHRVTLDEQKADDLTQDTLLAVLKSMGGFRQTDRFWAWVFTIATNGLRQFYRSQAVRKAIQMSSLDEARVPPAPSSGDEGPGMLSRKELGELTRRAMSRIDERDRMVLALRFYEDMPHAEIARVLGCSELMARVTFFRAKHSLKRELKGLGVGATALMAALMAFGQMTLPSSASAAAVAVNGAAVFESAMLGLLSVKAKAAAIAAVLVMALAWCWHLVPADTGSSGGNDGGQFVHFVHQSLSNEAGGGDFPSSGSKGAYEQWYHFPKGAGGPFLFRMQRWTPKQTEKLCWWVEAADGSYYVHSGEKRIYRSNAHLYNSNHSTKVLPTDPPEFCRFVRETEGQGSQTYADGGGVTYERDPATGVLKKRVDTRFPGLGAFVTTYDYGPQDTKLFDAPTGMPVRDERDEMHKRGWAYFRLEGKLGNRAVHGVGRLPFVYREAEAHSAWLRLSIGGKPAAVDNGERAAVVNPGTGQVTTCPGGSLFMGLSRPWTGFHTMDAIRRAAAEHRMWFSTSAPDSGTATGKAPQPGRDTQPADEVVQVTVVDRTGPVQQMARFMIDVEKDLLRRIEFWAGPDGVFDQRIGELACSYLADLREAGGEFVAPAAGDIPPAGVQGRPTPLWPIQLLGLPTSEQGDGSASRRSGPLTQR